jgi:hypothetical protein
MTKYTVIPNSSDVLHVASDRVWNAAGAFFDVDANAYNSAGTPYLIFTDNISVVTTLEFITTSNRVFAATARLAAQ